MKDGVYIGTYPIKIALLGGIVGFVVTYIAFKVVKTRMTKNELIYDMVIKIKDKELSLSVRVDKDIKNGAFLPYFDEKLDTLSFFDERFVVANLEKLGANHE